MHDVSVIFFIQRVWTNRSCYFVEWDIISIINHLLSEEQSQSPGKLGE